MAMFDICSLLVVDCGVFGVTVKAFNISRGRVVHDMFSGRLFGAREVVGYYYQLLVYSNVSMQKPAGKT